MADEEKKKPGIIRKILSRIGLTFLAFLIIAGLFFQIPWKITALLLIILAACTILPVRFRKWFWASAGVIILVLIIWVFLPEDNSGWQPYKFKEEFTQLNEKYAVPENENAATIYNKLLVEYDSNTFEPNLTDPNVGDFARRKPWSAKDYPELSRWLQGQKDTITTLQQAAQKDRCWFTIPANKSPFDTTAGRNSTIRQWAYLLAAAVNNDFGEGRIDSALEKCRCIIMMSRHICQQLTTIDILTGIAVESLALRQLDNFIVTGNPCEENLNFIEASISRIEHDWTADLPKILEDDKRSAKEILSVFYEINQNSRIRFSRDPFAAMRPAMKSLTEDKEITSRLNKEQMEKLLKSAQELSYWQRKFFKAWSILYWFCIPTTPQEAAEVIDKAYEKYYTMAEQNYTWNKEPNDFSSFLTRHNFRKMRFNFNYLATVCANMAEKSYNDLHSIYLRTAADKKGSIILIAIRRYKNKNWHWPENLEQIKSFVQPDTLIDPLNNGSFVYKLTGDTFTLYSKGENNIDENGQYESNWPQEAKPDDRLIWPPKGYKMKEKDANDPQQ